MGTFSPGFSETTWTGAQTFEGNLTITDVDIALSTTTGTAIGTATNQLLAFHGSTPVNQAGAYTQTFSTADKTHENRTAVSIGDLVATDSGVASSWGSSTEAGFDTITTVIDQLIADQADTAQIVNAIIDDLQEKGLAG